MLIGKLHKRIFFLGILRQILSHLSDEFAGGVRAGFEAVGNLLDCIVADLQLLFVNECVIYAVDVVAAQHIVIDELCAVVMLESQGFKEIHIDY